MTQANKEFRNKIFKTTGEYYISIDANGDVGYGYEPLEPEALSWDYGIHNHWIDRDGNLKMRSVDCLVLDYGIPEDLENV